MSGRIQVADSFFLLAAAVGLVDQAGVGLQCLAAAAIHEAGHALAVRLCGGRVLTLRLTAVGGVLRYRLPRPGGRRAALIAAAGPLAGLAAAFAAAGAGMEVFAGANLLLSAINLLPVRPLDGGQLVCALLPGRARPAVEGICCLACAAGAVWLAAHGGGCGALAFCGVLGWEYRKNLQNRGE